MPEALGLSFLAQLDPKGGWAELVKHPEREITEELAYENPALYVKSLWARAIQSHSLPQVAFFMQEVQEKALIQAGIMSTVKAISLSFAGARGEGLVELEDARHDLAPDARNRVTQFLVHFYEHSYAREKSQSLLKDLVKVSDAFFFSPRQAACLADCVRNAASCRNAWKQRSSQSH